MIFIKNLPDIVQTACKIFADDTKIYGLHDDLLKWPDSCQLHFNAGKCTVLHIGKKNNNHDC